MSKSISVYVLASLCIGINVALGTIVYLLKLPIYLDSIGIMVAAILVPGTRWGAFIIASLVGIISFVAGGLLINPFLPWFIGTAIAGALYGAFVVRPVTATLFTMGSTGIIKTIMLGIGWGIVAAIVSAPVAVYLFGGVTGSGSALVTLFFVKTGHQLLDSVLLSGFSIEPIDKTIQMILAIYITRSTPAHFRERFSR